MKPPAARFTNKPLVLCLLISLVVKTPSEGLGLWVPVQDFLSVRKLQSLGLFVCILICQYFYNIFSRVSHSQMFFPPFHLSTFYPSFKAQHKYHLLHEAFPNRPKPSYPTIFQCFCNDENIIVVVPSLVQYAFI